MELPFADAAYTGEEVARLDGVTTAVMAGNEVLAHAVVDAIIGLGGAARRITRIDEAGNADVLLTAGALLGDSSLTQAAQEAGRMGIERYRMHNIGWTSGVSDPNGGTGRFENPSLMIGLAGTGYFYLRLAQAATVPSVLLLSGQ